MVNYSVIFCAKGSGSYKNGYKEKFQVNVKLNKLTNERIYALFTVRHIMLNPLGPRILLNYAPLFPGFLANSSDFASLCSKICRKNYSILTITSWVYFEE